MVHQVFKTIASFRPKQLVPKSLFGRSLLIIILPIAIMQIAVLWAFFDRHWVAVTARLSQSVAGDIAVVLDSYSRAPAAALTGQDRLNNISPDILKAMNLAIALEDDARLPTTVKSNVFRVLDRTLRQALAAQIDEPFWFDTRRYAAYVEVRVQVPDGVLRIIVPRHRVFARTGHIFLLSIVLATVLLTAICLAYIRNQVKPIERLAAAAEQFGRGVEVPPFRLSGAAEVRQAAAAFQNMRERIDRHIDQRTAILAGVSHDLRTPLTRFRLQLALMPAGPMREAMGQDVADMETVLEEYLTFAQGVSRDNTEPVIINDLVAAVCADFNIIPDLQNGRHRGDTPQLTQPDPSHPATVQAGPGEQTLAMDTAHPPPWEPDHAMGNASPIVEGRPVALRRCLVNLVDNAAVFGETLRVSTAQCEHGVTITVEDDGPGIPQAQREEAFRPFNRLERSGAKSGNRMGYGLGLSIARDIARSHGGDIELDQSDLGGLKATISLPT